MHRSGPARRRILPILLAGFGLFAAAGCAATGVPEAPSLTAGSSIEATAAPSEAAAPVTRSGVDQTSQRMVAVEDARLPRLGHANVDPLLAPARQPREEWVRHPADAQATAGGRRHVATLQFGRGSASLAREEYIILQAVAALRAGQGGRIEVIGHADRSGARGSAARRTNQRASARRASAVADAIVGLGVPRGAIVAEGRGDREPRYAETNAVGRAGNRRAEIYLLSPARPPATAEHASDAVIAHDDEANGAGGPERPADPSVAEPERNGLNDGVGAVDAPPAAAAASAAGDQPSRRRTLVATLYFGHASSRLGERERAIIEAAAAFQRQSHGAVVIVGHASAAGAVQADPEGLQRANRTLSLARAEAVAKRLAASGIEGEDLSVVSRGSEEPAFAENDAAAEAGNRRVEIYVDLPTAVRLAEHRQDLPR